MGEVTENEDWIIDYGDQVIEKKTQSGIDSLSDWERLVYCLWVADYMMRSAGDCANAQDIYPQFQTEGKHLAESLSLPITSKLFALSTEGFESEYFHHFEAMCDEIRNARINERR